MAKRYPANIKQAATWATGAPNPHADLGAAASGYITLSTAQGNGNIADADTADVYVLKDASNWAIYEDADYDHGNTRIDFSGATLHSSAGTISDSDAVTIEVDCGQGAFEAFLTAADIAAMEVSAPAGPTSTGSPGQWARSGIFLYWCYDTNAWMRLTGATSGW